MAGHALGLSHAVVYRVPGDARHLRTMAQPEEPGSCVGVVRGRDHWRAVLVRGSRRHVHIVVFASSASAHVPSQSRRPPAAAYSARNRLAGPLGPVDRPTAPALAAPSGAGAPGTLMP